MSGSLFVAHGSRDIQGFKGYFKEPVYIRIRQVLTLQLTQFITHHQTHLLSEASIQRIITNNYKRMLLIKKGKTTEKGCSLLSLISEHIAKR